MTVQLLAWDMKDQGSAPGLPDLLYDRGQVTQAKMHKNRKYSYTVSLAYPALPSHSQ